MKKKFFRLSATGLLFFSGVMEIGWRFFNMVVCCKRGGRKKERKKWFELSHIRDNHPRNGYAKEYDESRAWCETQKMQDCYIQSVDGLKPVSYTHLKSTNNYSEICDTMESAKYRKYLILSV